MKWNIRLTNCLNWQGEDASAHRSGALAYFVPLKVFTSAYSTLSLKALWFANLLKDSRSYPQNSQRKKNLFIKQHWLLNSWPLFFFACCSWYPYSWEGIHFCSPKGELDFFCFTHSIISLSMGSATAGQILGHHMGLIFVFLQLIGCLFKSFGTLKCYKVKDTCSCNCLLIMASSIPKSQIKNIIVITRSWAYESWQDGI